MYYNNLAIEVTRRCNMGCAHCLRGEAENINMLDSYIERFFEHVEGIGSLLFTGGEPTLNLWTIERTLDICKSRNIPVDGFYIVTNGKFITNEFLHLAIDWTTYCLESYPGTIEEGLSGITVSKDMFHEPVDERNLNKLRSLAVFREDDKTVDWESSYMYKLGRAKHLVNEDDFMFKNRTLYDIDVSGNMVDNIITLTCTGHILSECDYEYGEEESIAIGKATSDTNMKKYLAFLRKRQKECEAA